MSTEAQTQNQSQQSIIYDERIRQLINSIDASSVSLAKTSIIDAIVPKQISLYHQQHRDQCRSSTNDIRTISFDRFPLWNNHSSAWAFCGRTPDEVSAFTNQHYTAHHVHYQILIIKNNNIIIIDHILLHHQHIYHRQEQCKFLFKTS